MGEVLEPRRKSLRSAGPWAPVPAWIIHHPEITDRGLRLYAVLMLMSSADNSTAFPSRRKLGEVMGCSVDKIDRCLRELVKIEAVEVSHRFRAGTNEWTSSEYLLAVDNPDNRRPDVAAILPPPSRNSAATVAAPLPIGGRTDAAAEQEVLNQNQVNENHLTRPERIELVWDAYCKAFVPEGKSPRYLLAVRDRLVRDHGHYVIEVLDAYRPTQIADRVRAREQQAMAQ